MKNTKTLPHLAKALALILIFTLTIAPALPAQAKFNAKTAKKNITVTYTETAEGILATYKNKNKTAVSLNATMKFKDAAGKVIAKETITNACFGKKRTMAYFFKAPLDSNNRVINYSSYKGAISVAKTSKTDYAKNIVISTDIQPILCNVTAQNNSGNDLTSIHATFVFYDSAGQIILCKNQYINCGKANTSIDLVLNYAEYRSPSKVKVYKNWAY